MLPPFPIGLDVEVTPPPVRLLAAGAVGTYVPEEDVFIFGPTLGIECLGGLYRAVLPDQNGNHITIVGPCQGPLPL